MDTEDGERHRLALAAINLTVYDWNLETGEIHRPPLGHEVRRLQAEVVHTADGWANVVHPDDFEAHRAALLAHIKGETPRLDHEYRYLGTAGEWRWVRQYGIALRHPDGRAHRLVGATADITESRERDAELQAARAETERARRHMQALLDNMRDGVGSAEADGTYIASNKAMFELVSIPHERIVALGTMQNIWRYQYENHLVPSTAATADEHVAAQFALFTRADGRQQVRQRPDGTWVERCFLRMPDDSRLVVVRDITELKLRETELALERDAAEAARAEAEAANQAKSTFLATMSHEIRTPMNGVLGMLEMLEHQSISSEQRAIVATMRSSASALLRIIDDVLDFSKIEAGRIDLEETPFSLSELVGGTVEAMRPQATAKGLRFTCGGCARFGRRADRRPGAGAPDPVQSARQCGEVHAERQRPCQRDVGAGWRGPARRDAEGDRYRHRHQCRRTGATVPAIRPGRQLDHAPVRRQRPWSLDRAAARATDGW